MRIGARLLQTAGVALYLGPLLAGLAGFGWGLMPPFLAIFTLWLAVTRPQQWPQAPGDWLRRETWLAVAAQVLAQALLVAVCFGLGRGIGGVAGRLPDLHPILPLILSTSGLVLARLVWNPEQALAEGRSIDELLYPQRRPPRARRLVPGDGVALDALLALPDAAPAAEALALLDDLLDDADSFVLLAPLVDTLSALPASRHAALRGALILWATEPERFAAGTAPGALRAGFAAAGSDPALLHLLLPRARALALALPDRADRFPAPAVIEDIALRGLPHDLADALADLAALLRGEAGPRPTPVRRAAPPRLQSA